MTSLPFAQVIGDPIAQSKSPMIHRFWLKQLGMEADYSAQQVALADAGDYIARSAANPQWRGCNVTMPLKQVVGEYLDAIDPIAAKIGAVNTVYRDENAQLRGTNTDAAGFLEPLREQLSRQHYFRMARILGTGGAARAIVTALYDQGFTLVLAGRNPEKARAILDELAPKGEHHAVHLDHFAQPTKFAFDDREGCLDLVVNASPLGMEGQPPLAFDWSHAPPGSIAYDIITHPLDTEFLVNARGAGFVTVDGLSMLIGQAAVAFEKFYGVAPPRQNDVQLRESLSQ